MAVSAGRAEAVLHRNCLQLVRHCFFTTYLLLLPNLLLFRHCLQLPDLDKFQCSPQQGT
jgi:hypothetical protein